MLTVFQIVTSMPFLCGVSLVIEGYFNRRAVRLGTQVCDAELGAQCAESAIRTCRSSNQIK
jgi:hypothetical protein